MVHSSDDEPGYPLPPPRLRSPPTRPSGGAGHPDDDASRAAAMQHLLLPSERPVDALVPTDKDPFATPTPAAPPPLTPRSSQQMLRTLKPRRRQPRPPKSAFRSKQMNAMPQTRLPWGRRPRFTPDPVAMAEARARMVVAAAAEAELAAQKIARQAANEKWFAAYKNGEFGVPVHNPRFCFPRTPPSYRSDGVAASPEPESDIVPWVPVGDSAFRRIFGTPGPPAVPGSDSDSAGGELVFATPPGPERQRHHVVVESDSDCQ
jgi:hypothetical protein